MIHLFSKYSKLKVNEAIKTATKAHANQNRKSTDIPYVFHPFEAAMELAYEGYGSDLVIAALLHDTLEDTALTKKIIKRKFGKKVLDIVTGASEIEVAGRGSDTWQERKEHTLNYRSVGESENAGARSVPFCLCVASIVLPSAQRTSNQPITDTLCSQQTWAGMFPGLNRAHPSGKGDFVDGRGADHVRGFLVNRGEIGSDIRDDAH